MNFQIVTKLLCKPCETLLEETFKDGRNGMGKFEELKRCCSIIDLNPISLSKCKLIFELTFDQNNPNPINKKKD
jgi:hypothetical protein